MPFGLVIMPFMLLIGGTLGWILLGIQLTLLAVQLCAAILYAKS